MKAAIAASALVAIDAQHYGLPAYGSILPAPVRLAAPPANPAAAAEQAEKRDNRWNEHQEWQDRKAIMEGAYIVASGTHPLLTYPANYREPRLNDISKILQYQGYKAQGDGYHSRAARLRQQMGQEGFDERDWKHEQLLGDAHHDRAVMNLFWLRDGPAAVPFAEDNDGALMFLQSAITEKEAFRMKKEQAREREGPLNEFLGGFYESIEDNWGMWIQTQTLGLLGYNKAARFAMLATAADDQQIGQSAIDSVTAFGEMGMNADVHGYIEFFTAFSKNRDNSFAMTLWGMPEFQTIIGDCGYPGGDCIAPQMASNIWYEARSYWAQQEEAWEDAQANKYFDAYGVWPEDDTYFQQPYGLHRVGHQTPLYAPYAGLAQPAYTQPYGSLYFQG